MKTLAVLVPFLLAAILLPSPVPASERDPRAEELARRTMAAMGGEAAFAEARVLIFEFAVEREGKDIARIRHAWDRWTGDYRVEGQNREGRPFTVIFNVNSREGNAWLGGVEVPAEEKAAFLEMGYGRFINDSYWFLMPWKWLDPGVNLAFLGERVLDGTTFDGVELTFGDDIGLTSNDRYQGFVNRETGLMERWEYVLQDAEGNPGTGEPSIFVWKDWITTDSGLKFSTRKEKLGEGPPVAIHYPTLRVEKEVPEGIFDPEVTFTKFFSAGD